MIFISYRREDAASDARWLYEKLKGVFGPDAVFCDVETIRIGDVWSDELRRNAKAAKVMLVVIGRGWQEAKFTDPDRKGKLRLDDEQDWVRQEILTAARHRNRIIALYLPGVIPPTERWLQARGLEVLSQTQHFEVPANSDLSPLLSQLKQLLPPLPSPSSRPSPTVAPRPRFPQWGLAVAGGVLFALAALVVWLLAFRGGSPPNNGGGVVGPSPEVEIGVEPEQVTWHAVVGDPADGAWPPPTELKADGLREALREWLNVNTSDKLLGGGENRLSELRKQAGFNSGARRFASLSPVVRPSGSGYRVSWADDFRGHVIVGVYLVPRPSAGKLDWDKPFCDSGFRDVVGLDLPPPPAGAAAVQFLCVVYPFDQATADKFDDAWPVRVTRR